MRATLTVIAVALVGLFGAVSLGYAAYVVSRDQVGLPVTKIKAPPGSLAPTPPKPRARKRVVPPPPPPPPPSTTTREPGDDHGGRSRGGSGSGRSGGGHGGDD
jgi:hypothetical protein